MNSNLASASKFLSYLLRHHPESIDLSMDENGWVSISELIKKAEQHGKSIDREEVEKIVLHGNKNRFIISNDRQYIRACYGHSVDIDLGLGHQPPPRNLFHGTAQQHVGSILQEGLRPGNRNFVHLSTHKKDAWQVGSRHGEPVILIVQAHAMAEGGYDFYQSESEAGIWLTKYVPPKFIENSSDY